MRLFIALELPSEARAAAAALIARLRSRGADLKWVAPEAMHLTLKFLGESDPSLVPALAGELAAACQGVAPLALALQGCGAFPGRGAPRVVWLGLAGDTARLADLAGGLDHRLTGLGFPPEERPFTPHLTLGRARGRGGRIESAAGLLRELAGLAAFAGPAFSGRRVALIESTLTPRGPVYRPLHQVALA